MTKPLIGITASGLTELSFSSRIHDAIYSMPEPYVASVSRAGGIPVLIPPIDGISDILQKLDGIVFSGGADVHPSFYNGDVHHPKLQNSDQMRDKFEIELIKLAVKNPNLPILTICRGTQVLNIALGGTLLEHLPEHVDKDIHRSADGLWTDHDVTINDGSLLADITGTPIVHTTSGHHQALGNIANDLHVVASAKDTIVEAVEHNTHPWCLAVQWHPERTTLTDPTQQAIFDALIKESAA